jgi:hypothetical protein
VSAGSSTAAVTGDLGVLVQLAGAGLVLVGCVAAAAWLLSRHRAFTRGLRGTALVVDVRPTSLVQRRSVLERATETVVVATAQVPRGVPAPQKVPAGQYAVGQVVPVVQHPRDPHRVYLDRPDLEQHPVRAVLYLVGAGVALVLLVQTATGRL